MQCLCLFLSLLKLSLGQTETALLTLVQVLLFFTDRKRQKGNRNSVKKVASSFCELESWSQKSSWHVDGVYIYIYKMQSWDR